MEGDNERRRSFVNKKTAPYIFLLPMILLFGVFMVYPVIKSLALSFYDFEGGDYLFCGINNYVTMCKDPVFWKSLGNTFIYLAIQVPVMVILSLILGVLVEESFLRFRTCYRVSVFLPSVTALVAYAMIFKLLFNTDFGLVNHILRTFGLGGVDWLNTVWGARAVVIMGITWRWTGYNTIIMIAGLKGIPMELYESADIDGASFLQRFFRITIPMVKSIILFVSITSTIGTLQLFDESFVLTKGGPDNATITIGHYLYNTGFSYYKFGYAAALSYALVLIIGISYWDIKTGHVLTADNLENRFTSRYMDIPNTPLYPFGFGLSYTEFDVSDVEIKTEQDKRVHVHCKVSNTGNVAGAEVVQCYYETLHASVVRPKKELVRFQKVFLDPGEKKNVDFYIDPKEFSYYDKNMEIVSSGMQLRISAGNSSDHEWGSSELYI